VYEFDLSNKGQLENTTEPFENSLNPPLFKDLSASFKPGPFIHEGICFAASREGCVYRIVKRESVKLCQTSDPIELRPLIIDDKIFVASSNYLHCFNWKNGNFIKKSDSLMGEITTSPIYDGQRIYVGTYPGGISAISPSTLKIMAWGPIELPGGVKASPSVVDNILWVGGYEKDIYAVDLKTGTKLDVIYTQQGFASPFLIYENTLFCIGRDAAVYAYSTQSKKQLWQYKLQGNGYVAPACDGKYLYVAMGNALYSFFVEDLVK
jgi:outer membrane protein assembly factor BamB